MLSSLLTHIPNQTHAFPWTHFLHHCNSRAHIVSCVVFLFLKAIPKEAFVKDLSVATYYLARDLAGASLGLAGLFAIQDLELQPVAYWSASAFCWMIEGEAVSFFPLPI